MLALEMTTVAEMLSEYMGARRMSDKTAALSLGVSVNSVNAWRRGIRKPEAVYSARLAKFLGKSESEIREASGHAGAPTEAAGATELPAFLASLLAELNERELRVVEATAQTLLEVRAEAEGAAPKQPEPDSPPPIRRIGPGRRRQ